MRLGTSDQFDVAVIGGGVVGCAILRAFALGGVRATLLEAKADLLSGASKANSAILHTGFDAPEASLELACIRAGYDEYMAIRERLNLPVLRTGALVVAWTDAELDRLPEIVNKAHQNLVSDVCLVDRPKLFEIEPNLNPSALGAVLVPRECVIDPWSTPLAYVHQSMAHGAVVKRSCSVTDGSFADGRWTLNTSVGEVRAGVVINCAGLNGDIVEGIARPAPFSIRPRKGQFVVFDKSAAGLVSSIILPVPTERTKGVVLVKTVFGNLMVGPTAEDQDDRNLATVTSDQLRQLMEAAKRMIPAIAAHGITATYAGLRPATEFKDYQIEILPNRRWITVAGIRSTGLTGALGIASHVRGLYSQHFGSLQEEKDPKWTPMPNLAECGPRPYQDRGRSEIVCHCELVTQGEIENALTGPLPAGDVGGLKRRTRAMMGRCQGFYCSARVTAIVKGRLSDIDVTGV